MNLEISTDIQPLTEQSTVKEAQVLFDESIVSHLPILKGEQYIGIISECDVRSYDTDQLIGDFKYNFEHFYINEEVNELELLEVMSKNDSNLMPVVTPEFKYLGYVELLEVVSAFGVMPFLSEHGNIIVVQKGINDHSISEICQIVESNNTKVFAVYISNAENDVIQTTVKMGNGDFNSIIQTFRRYGYEIISDHYDDVLLNNLKERSKYLDKYLNM